MNDDASHLQILEFFLVFKQSHEEKHTCGDLKTPKTL